MVDLTDKKIQPEKSLLTRLLDEPRKKRVLTPVIDNRKPQVKAPVIIDCYHAEPLINRAWHGL